MSTKICPHCESEIQAEAKKCRYCKEWLEQNKENIIKEDENPNNQEILEKQKFINQDKKIKDKENNTNITNVEDTLFPVEVKRKFFIVLGIVLTIVVSWVYYSWYKENISYNVNKWDSVELQLPLHTQILSFLGLSDEVDLLNEEIRGCSDFCYWNWYGSSKKIGEELGSQNEGRIGYWNKSGNFYEKHTLKITVEPQELTTSVTNINLTTGTKGDEGVMQGWDTGIKGNYLITIGYQGAENQDKYKYLQNARR